MKNTTSAFQEVANKTGRVFDARLVFHTDKGDKTYGNNEIIHAKFTQELLGEALTLGDTTAKKIDLQTVFIPKDILKFDFTFDIALKVAETQDLDDPKPIFEWVSMGTFKHTELIDNENSIFKITAYDKIYFTGKEIKTANLPKEATMQQILDEICNSNGFERFVLSSPPTTKINNDVFGTKQERELLGYIAEYYGGFFIADGNKLKLITLGSETPVTITGDTYYTVSNGDELPVNFVEKYYDQENRWFVDGGLGSGMTISIHPDNFFVDEARLPAILAIHKGKKFIPFEIDTIGNPSVEVGDSIRIETVKGQIIETYVTDFEYSYKGVFSGMYACSVQTSEKRRFTNTAPTRPDDFLYKEQWMEEYNKDKEEFTESVNDAIAKAEDDAEAMKKELQDEISQAVTDWNTEFDEAKTNIDNSIGNVSKELGEYIESTDEIIERVNSDLSDLFTGVEANSGAITSITAEQGALTVKVGEVTETADKALGKATEVGITVDGFSTRVGSLETSDSTQNSNISQLQQTASGLTSTVSTHTTEINGLNTTVSTHTSEIKQTSDKISMVVSNGSTASAVQLTPNALTAIAKDINLKGNVQFNSLVEGDGTNTQILGGKIKTGSISADKVVVSNQQNLMPLTEGEDCGAFKWLGGDFKEWKTYTHSVYAELHLNAGIKLDASNLKWHEKNVKLKLRMEMYANQIPSGVNFYLLFRYRHRITGEVIQSVSSPIMVSKGAIYSLYEVETPNLWVSADAGQIDLYFMFGSGMVSKEMSYRSFSLVEMNAGELIVDGAIKANHIVSGSAELGAVTSKVLSTEALNASWANIGNALIQKLWVGNMMADYVKTVELNASKITTGILRSANGAFRMDLNIGSMEFYYAGVETLTGGFASTALDSNGVNYKGLSVGGNSANGFLTLGAVTKGSSNSTFPIHILIANAKIGTYEEGVTFIKKLHMKHYADFHFATNFNSNTYFKKSLYKNEFDIVAKSDSRRFACGITTDGNDFFIGHETSAGSNSYSRVSHWSYNYLYMWKDINMQGYRIMNTSIVYANAFELSQPTTYKLGGLKQHVARTYSDMIEYSSEAEVQSGETFIELPEELHGDFKVFVTTHGCVGYVKSVEETGFTVYSEHSTKCDYLVKKQNYQTATLDEPKQSPIEFLEEEQHEKPEELILS